MFNAISPQYDFFNRILSFGTDQRLRRKAVRLAHVPSGGKLLDLCTGTGDLLKAAQKLDGTLCMTGLDFSGDMLALARQKVTNVQLVQGDCLNLPLRSATFDALTICWGMRNLVDIPTALSEMARVLKNGGRLVVLEFSRPPRRFVRKGFDQLFRLHSKIISRFTSLPAAYEDYLPGSISRFPPPEELSQMMTAAGFRVEKIRPRLFGEICFHIAVKETPTS